MSTYSHAPNGSTTRQRTSIPHAQDEEAGATSVNGHSTEISEKRPYHRSGVPDREGLYRFWARFSRKGKKNIGIAASLRAIALSSWLNVLLILIPFAWVSHFHWSSTTTFILSFLAIIPLEKLFDYGGEQLAFYCGTQLGDLIIISLNNTVEATLAIILLIHCELKLLQSTIIGVVILHLLLIPGTAFITGGARIVEQDLHAQLAELNRTMLTVGVLSLLIPAAFFAALDRGGIPGVAAETVDSIVSDAGRDKFLKMSRGMAVLLLLIYICSRIYLHNPPGDDNALREPTNAPVQLKHHEEHLLEEDPELNQYVCILMIIITVGLMAGTAEWLAESIEPVREAHRLSEEWFGLILLPLLSFAGDGAVAIVYFIRSVIHHYFLEAIPPATLAKARAIDMSIQFTLFWMPFIILLGWWKSIPVHLLFDFFEVSVLLGACFVVNYVTSDAKTNWAEGFAMVSFYLMIALCAWFYPGQTEIGFMDACLITVEEAIANAASGGTPE